MNILQGILSAAGSAAGKFFDNKAKQAEFMVELQRTLMEYVSSNEQARASLIMGEIQGESWLQRNWRPVLMLSIVSIVVNNYILTPYIALFFSVNVALDLPEKLWNLMMIGVGGYIPGRSLEKAVKTYVEAKKA